MYSIEGLQRIEEEQRGYDLVKIWLRLSCNLMIYEAFLALQTYHKNYIVVQPTIFNDAPLPLMDAIVVGVPPLSEPISSVTL